MAENLYAFDVENMSTPFHLENLVGQLARESAEHYLLLINPPLHKVAQAILWRLTIAERMTLTDLAKAMCVSPSVAKKYVDELIELGLLATHKGPRGSTPLSIAPDRKEEIDRWKANVLKSIRYVFEDLEPNEKVFLHDLLTRVISRVRQRSSDQSSMDVAVAHPNTENAGRQAEGRTSEQASHSSSHTVPSSFAAASVAGLKVTIEAFAGAAVMLEKNGTSQTVVFTRVQDTSDDSADV